MVESTAAPVAESWSRIDAWLAAHAPASLARLRPGAQPGALAAAERELGFPLPADLAASLACHDGADPECWRLLPEHSALLSAEGVVEQWMLWNEVVAELFDDEEEPPDAEGRLFWHPLWVPVAHFQGDLDLIDMRPGPGQGRLGWRSHEGGGRFDDAGWSLGAYLRGVADVLTTGGAPTAASRGWEAPVIGPTGELAWGEWPGPGRDGSEFRPAPIGLPG